MRTVLSISIFLFLSVSAILCSSCKREVVIKAPHGSLVLHVSNPENRLKYWVEKDGQAIIHPSDLGLRSEKWDLSAGRMETVDQKEVHTTLEPLWGPFSKTEIYYREVVIPFISEEGISMQIVFRVFEDGVAFRYNIPAQQSMDSIILTEDLSSFQFGQDFTCYALDSTDIENTKIAPDKLKRTSFSQSPMLVKTESEWVALSEASIYDMSMMYFVNPGKESAMRADIGISCLALPANTPWRVIQVGSVAGDFRESTMIASLNEPCDKEEFSWVRPGKCLWDHRNLGDTINGFVYGKDEATMKRLIDFAAGNNIRYLLIDGGWYAGDGPLFPREELNIKGIINYAKDQGVGIILYVDKKEGAIDWDLQEVLHAFREWGAAGIKYGFLSNEYGFNKGHLDRQAYVKATREIVRLCAEEHMLLNFHDRPVQLGGEHVTWPNMVTIEYCHAQQDGRPTPGRRKVEPHMMVSVPFINGLHGPLDMTNGFYDLEHLQNRTKTDPLGINSTAAGETARCMIYYSPMLILGDNGDEYARKGDLFEFIRKMPDTWDETRVLKGFPGDFIIMARRTGSNWFVAGITDEEEREFSIPLDFLGTGEYEATIYADDEDTHYQTRKESYKIRKITGTRESAVNVVMAPGGGFCMTLENTL